MKNKLSPFEKKLLKESKKIDSWLTRNKRIKPFIFIGMALLGFFMPLWIIILVIISLIVYALILWNTFNKI